MSGINVNLVSSILLISLLSVALYTDLTRHRISNKLVFCILLSGLLIQFYTEGLSGFGFSILGIISGFLLFMPFNLLGGMRAGDLKLMAAVGAYLATDTAVAAGLSLIAGACYGMIIMWWHRGFSEYFMRYSIMAMEYASSGKIHYQAPDANAVAATSFPYATAIATGTLLTLVYFK